MKFIDEGGAAFPQTVPLNDARGGIRTEYGLSKRELFAAMNMAAMHARDDHDYGLASPKQRANIALIDADALLKALNEAP